MMFPKRRRSRKFPLRLFSQSMRRWFCCRCLFIWILLILLVVWITIQRGIKLSGLFPLRPSITNQNLFPALQNISVGSYSESSVEVKQKLGSAQTQQTANPHQNEGNQESLHERQLSCVSTSAASVSCIKTWKDSKRSSDKVFIATSSRVLNSHTYRINHKATCRPKSQIVFLKTHKTASSSVLNILYRFGDSKNLTFALPLKKHSQMFYPFFFDSRFVKGFSSRSGRDFNIMCNHMRFRKSEVAKVMPADTFYFSILRHPVAMMESIFTYYKNIPAFQKAHSLEDFLNTCWKDYEPSVRNNHYAHNILAFDFGFDNNIAHGAKDLDERAAMAVTAIERDFHLVLISDYFDESMILLKHALCWSLEDVISFKLNGRSEQTRRKVSPETAAKIKQWNALDWRIYLHFNSTFWHKVESLVGQEQMKWEVSQLNRLRAKLADTCLQGGRAVDPSKIKEPDLKPFQYGDAVIQGYNLNSHLLKETKTICKRLITPELQYTNNLYTKQFQA